jgi:IS5 family transposase
VPDGATRPESLHDPDGRPILKGRLGKPVEFGYKAQVVENEDGVVVDHNVEVGNQPGAAMLVPVIERVARGVPVECPRRSTLITGMASTR